MENYSNSKHSKNNKIDDYENVLDNLSETLITKYINKKNR